MKLYVVYFYSVGEKNGYGASECRVRHDYVSIDDLSTIRKDILAKTGYDNLVILNWKELA